MDVMNTEFTDAPSKEPEKVTEKKPQDNVKPATAALVKRWLKDIQESKEHWAPAFKRMDTCMHIAAEGGSKDWTSNEKNYVVGIVPRHINLSVSQLYARDPRAVAKRRRRLMYQIWDGDPLTLQQAVMAVQPPPGAVATPRGMVVPDPISGAPTAWTPDPNAMALVQEFEQVRQQNEMIDKLGKSLEIVFQYYAGEQANGFKAQMKQLVRRTKVCGVGYVKLLFQRERDFRPKPDVSAKIDDTRNQIAALEMLMKQAGEGKIEADDAKMAELQSLMQQLMEQASVIVREGPLFEFPRSKEIIPSKKCRHLRTLAGAPWVAHEFSMSVDEVQKVYNVDISGKFTEYKPDGTKKDDKESKDACKAKLYEVQNIELGQTFVVCEGHDNFVKAPAAPDVKIERFFTIFPLVFNEVESEDTIYPPSDVWLLRHAQDEYNRSRQGLKEHRVAARPRWATQKGVMSEPDKKKLSQAEAFDVVELTSLKPGVKIEDLLQAVPVPGIDPNVYEVQNYFIDVQRSVGTQEANFGGTSKGSATEASISEQSRSISVSDNVDDLDELLTELAKATGHLCLLELSKETVVEIVGPGAVWPEHDMSREEIAKDLYLNVKAASTGRPNKAADLANMERAGPMLMQVPGMNPKVLAERYCEPLDIDMEEAYVEGLPSIQAMNAMAGKAQASTGDPATNPDDQGGKGANNARNTQQNEPQSQPAYPTSSDQPIST